MEHIEQLLIDVKESLERQLQGFQDEMRSGFAQINTRFDTQGLRLDRQAALIQTGSRWTARINEWSEKVDAALEKKDRQIADLTGRLEKLERKSET